jgi:general secretion pathway protein G
VRARGFTLIELMVTLAILALLASITLPLAEMQTRRSREAELRRALWTIRDAIDVYKRAADQGRLLRLLDDSGYPPTLAVLERGVADQRNPLNARIYFLRKVPRDPFCDCPEKSNVDSWLLRSYASSPSDPQPGRDVFDVYTHHTGVALDGTPYRNW